MADITDAMDRNPPSREAGSSQYMAPVVPAKVRRKTAAAQAHVWRVTRDFGGPFWGGVLPIIASLS